ncbi:MAG: hypothetical protein EXQ74_02255 [Thermoleophilia bacterium]|nr:hypothetical protein [Thermoleophilia bacterium]
MSIKDTIASMINDETAAHKRQVEYVTRELAEGRRLNEILDDPYLTNRLTPVQRRALVEEPAIVAAAHHEAVDEIRARLEELCES